MFGVEGWKRDVQVADSNDTTRCVGEFAARKTADGRKQPLVSHTKNASNFAKQFAEKFGCGGLAEAAGRYHDLGKMSTAFQDYIDNTTQRRGEVKHSHVGAESIYRSLSSCLPVAELLANCILSHHGRLRDYLSPEGNPSLSLNLSAGSAAVSDIVAPDIAALSGEFNRILALSPNKAFGASMLTKLIFSCLVDADRLDAYLFESRNTYEPQAPDWAELQARLYEHLANIEVKGVDRAMLELRRSISLQCETSGARERGIYRLNAPTGGGKTLAALRFALAHAKKHGMDRIIYVIPYLSIIEQTAKTIREAVGDAAVLEHHSNLLPDDPDYYRLHTDRWDMPIILTTQVQFLESVFSAGGSDLRKLHSMANSILIFDEVQTLPVKCVHLFNSAMNFLHTVCKSTVLLCTATQPLLDKVERKILLSPAPMIADFASPPERYKITFALRPNGYTYPELAEFVIDKKASSKLVIVNTKSAARRLAEELEQRGVAVLHLSTNMCPAHRLSVTAEVRDRLSAKESFVCVSTQLIEAGVDISFECVVRDLAGLDSIYQAAGRCNRNGEYRACADVFVVNIAGETLDWLPDIKIGAEITARLVADGTADIATYYRHYFHARKGLMDFPIDGGSIHDLLTGNVQGRTAWNDDRGIPMPTLPAAIRSAAESFYVIAPGRVGVVVPHESSSELLQQYFATTDISEQRKLLRQLGAYTVPLYRHQCSALEKRGALSIQNGILVLEGGFYKSEFGVAIDGNHEFLCM